MSPLSSVLNVFVTAYMGPKRTTSDGFDYTFQVNYLGHFLLTSLLSRGLTPTPSRPLRVINLASDSHEQGRLEVFDDLDDLPSRGTRPPYEQYRAYSASKLAMVLFTAQLARRQGPDIIAVAVHPGRERTQQQQVQLKYVYLNAGI